MRKLLFAVLLLLLLLPRAAKAGPWTRDQGRFFVATTYSYISARGWYQLDYVRDREAFGTTYTQHALSVYGEVGLVDRWLTMTLEGQLYRRATLEGRGTTDGMGDIRLGLWTGLLTKPVRLTFAVLLGVPTGDPAPSGATPSATEIARALPTGDGEVDVEGRASFGYSFGGKRRWPLLHYLVLEAGYWHRSKGFSDAFVYRAELGTKLPWKFVDRFWLIMRANGAESFISSEELARVIRAPNPTGLANGVTYAVIGLELFGRIWQGLGASVALDLALRARLLPTSPAPRFSLTYEF